MADEEPAFDVYAKPYVPLKWQDINKIPMPILTSIPAPWIDFNDYVLSFAGRWLTPTINTQSTAPVGPAAGSPPYSAPDPPTYASFFSHALASERQALQAECEEYNLYNVYMAPSNQSPNSLLLNVPGLREMSLRVEIGDIVHVRQLRFDGLGEPAMAPVVDNRGQAIVPMYSWDVQHDAVIWSMNRAQETLSLRMDNFIPGSFRFNICFTTQHHRLEPLREATIDTGNSLLDGQSTWLRSMLFPEEADGV